MAKVLIAPATLNGNPGPFLDVLQAAGFDLVFNRRADQLTEDELLQELAGMDASLAGSEPYTRRVLEAHPRLKVIARVGVGYDAVDVAAATRAGVAVCITPGTNQDAVAEHTYALILALLKGIVPQHLDTRAGRWVRQSYQPLRGKVLGVAGLGRIGQAVAARAAVFGLKVLAHEPTPDRDFVARHGITLVPMDRLLAESDILSLHMPLTPASRYFINRDTLARMKPTAVLINTARGALVNEADLADALRQGRLGGAGLDVFDQEPPQGSSLLGLDNVLLTPHTAGIDTQALQDMAQSAAEAIVSLSRGEWPAAKVVNPDVRAAFRWPAGA